MLLRAPMAVTVSEADSAGLTAACIATAAYYAAARAAEGSRTPWLTALGRFLLGDISRTSAYVSTKPDVDRYGD